MLLLYSPASYSLTPFVPLSVYSIIKLFQHSIILLFSSFIPSPLHHFASLLTYSILTLLSHSFLASFHHSLTFLFSFSPIPIPPPLQCSGNSLLSPSLSHQCSCLQVKSLPNPLHSHPFPNFPPSLPSFKSIHPFNHPLSYLVPLHVSINLSIRLPIYSSVCLSTSI